MPYALHFEILLCISISSITLADASEHSGGCRRRQLCIPFASTRHIEETGNIHKRVVLLSRQAQ